MSVLMGTPCGRGVGPAKVVLQRRVGSIMSNGGYGDIGSESSDVHHLYPAHRMPDSYPHSADANPRDSVSAAQALTVSGQSKLSTLECREPGGWEIVRCDVKNHTSWVPLSY